MKIDVVLSPDSSPAEICELGLLAERYGIHAAWSSNYPSSRDPFLTLAPLALQSKTLRVGPLVVTAYEQHPFKTAKALATLNELCDGRANILIGGPTGVNAAMGMGVERMVGRVRETVEVVKRASPDEKLNYNGDIFQVWNYQPTWATHAPPRIYVGANKPQMMKMSAHVADNIMVGDPLPERFSATMDMLDGYLSEAGRSRDDLRISGLVAWHVKADKAASISEARQQLALRGMLDPWYLDEFLDKDECDLVDKKRNDFFKAYKNKSDVIPDVPESILEKLVDNLSLSGIPADIDSHIERLQELGRRGLNEVALKLHDDQADAIRLIGEHIVPAMSDT
ncbi:MAG: LLM class flavin-dependent oxidoreductase [Gammaproteobacteria bacterium]|nr:LLM class flavin-dependent oxidoreductase [Gammaproteobacteria bacterium]